MSKMLKLLCITLLAVAYFNPSYAQEPATPWGTPSGASKFDGKLYINGDMYPPVFTALPIPGSLYYPKRNGAIALLQSGSDTSMYYFKNGWVLWASGSGNVNDKLDSIFVDAPGLLIYRDDQGYQHIKNTFLQDKLLSGGIVSWSGSGLTYDITPSVYNLNNHTWLGPLSSVTLAPADGTNDRKDRIIGDTLNQILAKTGTPSPSPVDATYNAVSELPFTTIDVIATDGTPSQITVTMLYDETGSPEWTPTHSGTMGIAFNNTDNHFHGTTDAFISTYTNNSQIILTSIDGAHNIVDGELFRANIWLNVSFQTNAFKIQYFLGSTPVTSSLLVTNAFGFNPQLVDFWQIIAIPFDYFTFTSGATFDNVKITMIGQDISGGGGFYMDYIQLQSGIFNVNPSSAPNLQMVTDVGNTTTNALFSTGIPGDSGGGFFATTDGSTVSKIRAVNTATGDYVGMSVSSNPSIDFNKSSVAMSIGDDSLSGSDKQIQMPNGNGVLALSINGHLADGTGNISISTTALPYTSYVAILTEPSAGANITANVLENTTGATMTWTRLGTGSYNLNSSTVGLFATNKTIINGALANGSTEKEIHTIVGFTFGSIDGKWAMWTNGNTNVTFDTTDGSNTSTDLFSIIGATQGITIQIKIYP